MGTARSGFYSVPCKLSSFFVFNCAAYYKSVFSCGINEIKKKKKKEKNVCHTDGYERPRFPGRGYDGIYTQAQH